MCNLIISTFITWKRGTEVQSRFLIYADVSAENMYYVAYVDIYSDGSSNQHVVYILTLGLVLHAWSSAWGFCESIGRPTTHSAHRVSTAIQGLP